MDLGLLFPATMTAASTATAAVCVVLGVAAVSVGKKIFGKQAKRLPPAVPGFPIIGNLLQLTEKKPHKTFAKWAETYGPIYTIRTGATTAVVLNSTELAKEALVTRHPSISTRRLPTAINVLTDDKSIVAMSDYNDFHRAAKRALLMSTLGATARKKNQFLREELIDSLIKQLYDEIKDNPSDYVNLRKEFQAALFTMALKQAIGRDVEKIYVEEFGKEVTKKEMREILVDDCMVGALEVDWRDFFPYLRWFPNPAIDSKVHKILARRSAVIKALIHEQRKQFSSGQEVNCYLDFLLSEDKFTDDQKAALIWESIIESSDTTVVSGEWAMFELAKNPDIQERLYREIQDVCGSQMVTEEHLPKLSYLNAVFQETLRLHSPVSVLPPRFVHEDVQIGGYDIHAGTDVIVNVYSCNMDKSQWDNPEEWRPERFLEGKYDVTEPYNTMAFGGGKRVCAGASLAIQIVCPSIGRMVQEFKWRLKEGEEDSVDTVQLTSQKLHPMLANITPRNTVYS